MKTKTLLTALLCCAMICWALAPVLAAGGKNHGETGSGETITGGDAQGEADQDRTGRGDGEVDPTEILLGD